MDVIPASKEQWVASLTNNELMHQVLTCFPDLTDIERNYVGVKIASTVSKRYSKRLKMVESLNILSLSHGTT